MLAAIAAMAFSRCPAQMPLPQGTFDPLNSMPDVPLASLSSRNVAPMGSAALGMEPASWHHAETENFIYHCFHGYVAKSVTIEAEFYYRVIAHDLNKDTSHWERKAHIFVFERPADWSLFQTKAKLDPWTGGIHTNNEVFIQRDPTVKFKGCTLGHETGHLVIDRFFGSNVPLWLNEGYAEYIARVAYSSFYRAKGYIAYPKTNGLSAENFIPINELSEMLTYPVAETKVEAFYTESEKLVRFMRSADKIKFLQLLDALSKGSLFENALHNAYGTRFPTPHLLETEFKVVATQPLPTPGPVAAIAH